MVINIYTDGSSRGNPGPGGYGVIMEIAEINYRKEFSQGFIYTTNNRMELLAVIISLEKIKLLNQKINIYTDSKYIIHAEKKSWIFNWEKNNFKKIKNIDLWKRFLIVYRIHTDLNFFWIKSHSNIYNERCHQLAMQASKNTTLTIDYGLLNAKI